MAKIAHPTTQPTTLQNAVEAFFSDQDLSPATRCTYDATYRALQEIFGVAASVASLNRGKLHYWFKKRWGKSAPATWNSRLTAIQVFVKYCRQQGWLTRNPAAGLERRRIPRDETRAIPFDELDRLWSGPDVALREKLLWRMLYSTAARANEVLTLNVEDLDLGRKRAVITGKGGHQEVIVWDAATARLLPRYLGGRRHGPLFVTRRQPNVIPAELDRSPDGRGRLSYQRAWALFRKASGNRWTLHQIRHSVLTHLGERGVSAPLLMAKSRHRDLRTLSRYVQPGVEAVARLTAEHDPACRGRKGKR